MKEWSPWVNIRILRPWVNSSYFIIIIIIIIINIINIIKIKRLITVCLILDELVWGMKSLGQHKNIMSLGQLKLFHYYY